MLRVPTSFIRMINQNRSPPQISFSRRRRLAFVIRFLFARRHTSYFAFVKRKSALAQTENHNSGTIKTGIKLFAVPAPRVRRPLQLIRLVFSSFSSAFVPCQDQHKHRQTPRPNRRKTRESGGNKRRRPESKKHIVNQERKSGQGIAKILFICMKIASHLQPPLT